RLVHGHLDPRARGALSDVCRRKAVAVAGAADAICGFFRLAALLAAGRGPGAGDRILASTARRGAATLGPAHRPAAACAAELPRHYTAGPPVSWCNPASRGPRPA